MKPSLIILTNLINLINVINVINLVYKGSKFVSSPINLQATLCLQ